MPHLPIRMLQGVGFGHIFQFLGRFSEERPAGAGQDQAAHLVPVGVAHETLEDRGMLGIHGDDLRAALTRSLHDKPSRANERFFIGKRNALFLCNGRKRRPQAEHPDDRRNDGVRLLVLRCGKQPLHAGENAELLRSQRIAQRLGGLGRCHNGKLGPEFPALLRHQLDVAARGQCRDLDWKLLDNLKRLPPDGAGGTENGNGLCHITLPQTG